MTDNTENTDINISNLDKVELLKKLWTNMKPASYFTFHTSVMVPKFNDELAKKAVKNYIDYFEGRCIKTDLSKDTVDPWSYDRDAGEGEFRRIVNSM